MRNRASAIVFRGDKILMEKVTYRGNTFHIVPGGGIEEGETPEEAAIRELSEECGVTGEIVRPLNIIKRLEGNTEYFFEVKIPDDAEVSLGYDPEMPKESQALEEVSWKSIHEISKADAVWLFAAGILEFDIIRQEVNRWKNVQI